MGWGSGAECEKVVCGWYGWEQGAREQQEASFCADLWYKQASQRAPRASALFPLPPSHLIEDVEGRLACRMLDDPNLFEQIRREDTAGDGSVECGVASVGRRGRKVQRDQLAEARRVVVEGRLGVAKGLEQRIELDEPLHDGRAADGSRRARHGAAERQGRLLLAEIFQQDLHRLGLPGAALAADEQALGVARACAASACLLSDSVEVRRQGAASAAKVALGRGAILLAHRVRVERERGAPVVGID